ncbi:MAG: M28 family peptidase [Gemmatimonadota bacterium]|nr:M28 family peptidase [Gemmatimonadota bacterium]
MRRHVTRLGMAMLMLVPLGSCAPGGDAAAPSAGEDAAASLAEAVMGSITVEGLERHARAIVQYERPSGGPGENAAIDSIVASLRADGVPVEVHTFDTYASDPVSASVRVPAAGLTLPAITMAYSGSASSLRAPLVDVGGLADLPDLEVGTGELLALEGGSAMDGERAGLPDVRGSIAVVEGQPRNVPTAVLALLGAEGVIFINPEERLNDLIVTSTWGTPSLRNYSRLLDIPSVQVTKSGGDQLRSLLAAGPVTAEIDAEVWTGRKTLRLAVARIEGPTPDAPYVLLGGHIDGWYHAGTDEGASNAAMVELAKAFHAERERLRRGLVVAWWPGHSNARYAGSTWFADHYFEELRDRAVAYLNIDGVGQIDAVRLSSTATASMHSLARRVVREAVGQEELPGSTPGRNSDQSFNGVGVPLLQFNHARSAEDGGYWWWHTPDDTYDKIDFDVLSADAGLYARAIAHLTADPVLPIDMVAEVEALGALIERRSQQAGGRFDLSEASGRQRALLERVRGLAASLSGHDGPDLDRAMLAVLRPIYRVMYDPIDPFHPDPGFSVGLLPGLAPVTILAEEDPSSDRYLFAETTLVRERNRLLEALDLALLEAERLQGRLGS